MSSSSGRKGTGVPRLFRKRSAFSRSRAVPPARRRPAMPSSRARHSCRPIAPSPTTPTRMIAHGIMPPGTRMTAAQRLRQPLERLYREFDYGTRVELDAIRFPLRYAAPRDRELVGLLTACLAYGRVDLFSGELEGVLARMGPSPAAFVATFDPRRDSVAFDDFWYRFNRPRDLVAFCIAAAPVDADRHPHRDHQPLDRPHAPTLAHLAHGGGDHATARGDRRGRPGEVRLRALPQADVGRLPRSPGHEDLRPVRLQERVPPLAGERIAEEARCSLSSLSRSSD